MTEANRLAIIGGGKIGEAMLSGLLRGSYRPADIRVVERYPDRGRELTERFGVPVVPVAEAVSGAQTILIAVKPQDIDGLLAELAQHVKPDQLVVSVAAGVPTARIEQALPAGPAVVRCMPNTPAVVDEAMTAVCAGSRADEAHLAQAERLLSAVGKVVRVPESQLDAVTALSGSGPAYFFFLVEAMIDAGILLGLPRALAAELIVQTAVGSAIMLRDSGEHPVQLREAVTSPAGTTISAIRELENHGVRAALLAAIEAARDRSLELGRAAEQS
jgi:pyrroline-5-carboxylate reductase